MCSPTRNHPHLPEYRRATVNTFPKNVPTHGNKQQYMLPILCPMTLQLPQLSPLTPVLPVLHQPYIHPLPIKKNHRRHIHRLCTILRIKKIHLQRQRFAGERLRIHRNHMIRIGYGKFGILRFAVMFKIQRIPVQRTAPADNNRKFFTQLQQHVYGIQV